MKINDVDRIRPSRDDRFFLLRSSQIFYAHPGVFYAHPGVFYAHSAFSTLIRVFSTLIPVFSPLIFLVLRNSSVVYESCVFDGFQTTLYKND